MFYWHQRNPKAFPYNTALSAQLPCLASLSLYTLFPLLRLLFLSPHPPNSSISSIYTPPPLHLHSILFTFLLLLPVSWPFHASYPLYVSYPLNASYPLHVSYPLHASCPLYVSYPLHSSYSLHIFYPLHVFYHLSIHPTPSMYPTLSSILYTLHASYYSMHPSPKYIIPHPPFINPPFPSLPNHASSPPLLQMLEPCCGRRE